MTEWQPIETAPKDATEVLGYVGPSYEGGCLILSYYRCNGLKAWRDWDQDIWEPTHWMPLPQPPETDDE